jgi:hypothetical protein
MGFRVVSRIVFVEIAVAGDAASLHQHGCHREEAREHGTQAPNHAGSLSWHDWDQEQESESG